MAEETPPPPKKKRDLYKSLGVSTLTREQFEACMKETLKRLRKACGVRTKDVGHGYFVTSGSLSFYVRKDGCFTCQATENGNKPVGQPQDEGVIYPMDNVKHNQYRLFIKAKPYETANTSLASKTYYEVVEELTSIKGKNLCATNKDRTKLKHLVETFSRLCGPPGFNFATTIRLVMGKVWKLLNQDALKIVCKCIGFGASSFDFNVVAANIEELNRIYAATPAIVPAFISAKWDVLTGRIPNPNAVPMDQWDVTEVAVIAEEQGWQRGFTYKSESVIQDTKAMLERTGSKSKSAWKFLCKMKPRWVRSMMVRSTHNGRGKILELFASVGMLPKLTVMNNVISGAYQFLQTNLPAYAVWGEEPARQNVTNETKLAFLRVAFATSLKKPAKTFWGEASLVWDWLYREGVNLDNNQRTASWKWYMEKQKVWHTEYEQRQLERRARERAERELRFAQDAEARKRFEASRKYCWESLVDEVERGRLKAYALTTAEALREEGKEMHHCVGGYDEDCEKGRSRIFSIRDGDKRVATLEITCNDNITFGAPVQEGSVIKMSTKWTLRQNRGHGGNQQIIAQEYAEEAQKIADLIIFKYNKAAEELNKSIE